MAMKHSKMAHHGTHHHSAGHSGHGHGKGKKMMTRVGGHNGHAHGAGRHLNHTTEHSKGCCSAGDYFHGTNEHMYE